MHACILNESQQQLKFENGEKFGFFFNVKEGAEL